MMGHRGCRLAVTYPEIAEMQTTAVIKAALNVSAKQPGLEHRSGDHDPAGWRSQGAGVRQGRRHCRPLTKLIEEAGSDMTYKVGTMIEIPRAALTADEIAKEAEFFSFGTNDLTQMTFGFSRDDAGKFLGAYYDKKIYENDPFAKLDQVGVGKLVKMACELGRSPPARTSSSVSAASTAAIPTSVEFCHNVGLTYVSCSPFRVPIARLAAAQAAIRNPRQ